MLELICGYGYNKVEIYLLSVLDQIKKDDVFPAETDGCVQWVRGMFFEQTVQRLG